MKKATLAVAIIASLSATQVIAVDFHGYVRAGLGASADGGGTKSGDEFNKTTLGRLGNEYDTYSEIGLGQELFNQDGRSMYFESMFEMSSDGNLETESSQKDSANFAIKQLNIQAKGYIPASPDAVIWAGKRFYQRHDIHIIDTKYWNVSGYGVGIENIKLNTGAISAAVIRADNELAEWDDTGNKTSYGDLNTYFLDLRYAGFSPWEGSWTEFGVDYAMVNPTDEQEDAAENFDNGLMLTAELSQSFALGYNKFVLQYMDKGLAQNAISQGGGWYDIWSGDVSEAKGYRFISTGDLNVTDNFKINHVLTYGQAQDHGKGLDKEELFSFVARPTYNWSPYNKTMLEVGYFDQEKTLDSGSEDKLSGTKFTISHAISTGESFFARPEIRFFASYFKDNENDNSFDNGKSADTINYGVQVEAWW
ncbi:maltoporin [Vibrio cholerae]|uniref:maltoporin n=1 Tax=Vibrio cholerae TaxID=666 RepID=UPI0013730371|nr:maltoporin [Vibrio cholerae]EGQ8121617.1 maltoporin [Vibrio cholerae]EKF9615781.1 maltoporin [Vibrio cholerae]EMA7652728.1 maltoporin [Vibrio cholerae]EMB6643552.1 maltoporin [Vibrio cholerae]MBJ6949042.1 maltoporin [Vibrio cholerae]